MPKIYIGILLKEKNQISEKTNCLFSSTLVIKGEGKGIIMATRMNTELRKISKAVNEAKREKEQTQLQKELEKFVELLKNHWCYLCCCVVGKHTQLL